MRIKARIDVRVVMVFEEPGAPIVTRKSIAFGRSMPIVHVSGVVVVSKPNVVDRQIVGEPHNNGNAVHIEERRPRVDPVVTPAIRGRNIGVELMHCRLNRDRILNEGEELGPILVIRARSLASSSIGLQSRERIQDRRDRNWRNRQWLNKRPCRRAISGLRSAIWWLNWDRLRQRLSRSQHGHNAGGSAGLQNGSSRAVGAIRSFGSFSLFLLGAW